ncbi:hypothetical protein [Pseudomonas maumuensis]|uniref:DksA C4-type domain-containing protein n=1 Tax=Pseudomonas maumuensis TaxID=2842354 RepID=A0ABX8NG60_9PSED|nr:hypothetical protein [Pseudomonas maumuensis]QXH55127.1 hypothetical protein KSS90_17475 [Pseudomonas maumuensis]
MSHEVDVLRQLINNGSLDEQEAMVRGIAQLAVDQGFENLSDRQQAVLQPHLTQACAGVEDPGGYHNDCNVILEGRALAVALEQEGYYGAVLCEDCVNETEQYAQEWERIKRE